MSPEIKELVDKLRDAILAESGDNVGTIVVCNYEAKRTSIGVAPLVLGDVLTALVMATKRY